jgi:hypothetical protein
MTVYKKAKSRRMGGKAPWIIIVLVILSPLELYQLRLLGSVNLRLFDSVAILWVVIFIYDALKGRAHIRRTPVLVLLLLYILSSTVTLVFVESPFNSIRGIAGFYVVYLSFIYVISYLHSMEDVETVVSVFITIGSVVAIMCLIQFFGYILKGYRITPPFLEYFSEISNNPNRGAFGYGGGLMRPYGFFGSSNRVGSYLFIPFFFSFFRFLHTGKYKIIYLSVVLLTALGIVISISRNAWVGVSIGLLFLWIFRKKQFISIFKRLMILPLLISLVLLFFYFVPDTGIPVVNNLNVFIKPGNATVDNKDLFFNHLMAAIDANIDSFGFGKGVQHFDDWAYKLPYVKIWGAHSNFILFLGESGIIGFFSQLSIVIYSLALSLKTYLTKTKSPIHKKYTSLILYGVAAYLGLVFTGVVRGYYFAPYTFMLLGLIIRIIQLRLGHSKFMILTEVVDLNSNET